MFLTLYGWDLALLKIYWSLANSIERGVVSVAAAVDVAVVISVLLER